MSRLLVAQDGNASLVTFKNLRRRSGGSPPPTIPDHDFRPTVRGEVPAAIVPRQAANLPGIAAHREFITGTEGNLPNLNALLLRSRYDPSLVRAPGNGNEGGFPEQGFLGLPGCEIPDLDAAIGRRSEFFSVRAPYESRHRTRKRGKLMDDRAVRTKNDHLFPGRNGRRCTVWRPNRLLHPRSGDLHFSQCGTVARLPKANPPILSDRKQPGSGRTEDGTKRTPLMSGPCVQQSAVRCRPMPDRPGGTGDGQRSPFLRPAD